MLQRMFTCGLFERVDYTLLDADPENSAEAIENILRWAGEEGLAVEQDGKRMCLTTPRGWLDINIETADMYEFAAAWQGKKTWDLVVAHAVLDLLDIPHALEQMRGLVYPGGWFYFSVNFDGMTVFEPVSDPSLEEKIMDLYHHSIDKRREDGFPGGDSRSGRHLFQHLREAGLEIIEAGSSDWVLFARGGEFTPDESYFLRHILYFFEQSLCGHPELPPGSLDSWLAERRAQIQCGELVYIAHQLDFLARRPLT